MAASSAKSLFSLVQGKTRIGWIGTGVMGNSMAGHIHRSGLYPVTCYNRSTAKTEILRSAGVKVASSVADLAANSDVIFTIVGYPSDVRSVILGEEGVLKHCAKGSVIVDMTTSEPSLAKEIATAAAQKGVHTLDCPVSGGDIGAKEAQLSIMVGGGKEIMDAIMPLFEMMGKLITYCGPAGAGQHTKMMNQILIASGMIGVVEGLLYAYKAGLDLDTAIRAVSAGAAGSWSISNLGPRIVQRNFDPGFFVEHFVKDMGIALAEAQRMNLALPGLSMANQFYIALCAQGHGRKGTHALALALEQLNGIQRPYKQ